MKEVWEDVKGFEGYYLVSNLGRVKGSNRVVVDIRGRHLNIKEKMRKLVINDMGYLTVILWKNNKNHLKKIHRLVAESFLKKRKEDTEVNHKNGIPTDNRECNLEWCTHSYNIKHAIDTGLSSNIGETHCHAKLSEKDVLNIRSLLENGHTHLDISNMFGVSSGLISQIKNRHIWKHI